MLKPEDLAAIELNAIHEGERDLKRITPVEQLSLVQQRAQAIVTTPDLKQRLEGAHKIHKPLRIKLGIDATAPELHLGNAVPLRLLQLFQRMGHKVVLIVGDFTATIGDPSGRVKERPVLTAAQVKSNIRRYEKQAALFLDMGKAEVRFNSEWYGHLGMDELFGYLRHQTVAQAMERQDFRTRTASKTGVTRAELLYATLQAIDSVKIGADIEIGGQDQLLNLIEGRELMGRLGLTPQAIVTVPLLPGTTGTGDKMSKSKGNVIAVEESAAEIYGRLMSIDDKDIPTYLTLLTDVTSRDRNALDHALKSKSTNPKMIKQLVARLVTRLVHTDDNEVSVAERAWEQTFAQHAAPTDAPRVVIKRSEAKNLADLLVAAKLAPSRSEAKRLVSGGSVKLVQGGKRTKVTEVAVLTKHKSPLLLVGKHNFVQVTWR